jgi:SSS family solute:Na+ symporter
MMPSSLRSLLLLWCLLLMPTVVMAQGQPVIDIRALVDVAPSLSPTQAVWLDQRLLFVQSSQRDSAADLLIDESIDTEGIRIGSQRPALIRTTDSALLIGGLTGDTWTTGVQSVRVGPEGLKVTSAGDLPVPIVNPVAVSLEDRVYVVGLNPETGKPALISMRFNGETVEDGQTRAAPSTEAWDEAYIAPQAAGERTHLFLMARDKVRQEWNLLAYDPLTDTWLPREPPPAGVSIQGLVPFGAHSFILLPGQPIDQGLAYHTITNRWSVIQADAINRPAIRVDALRESVIWLWPGEPEQPGRIVEVHPSSPPPNFGWLDYTTLAIYLLALVGLGAYFSRGENSTDQYFLAGQKIPWWAAALSLMATQVSSIGFIAVPAKTFATDWIYFVGILSWFVVVPIVNRVHIPFFRRLEVTSAYEYLEARFDVTVRLFAALTFCLLQIGRMAVVLYLPALVLSVVTGIPIITCILIMGVLATGYTVAGGMEAVIWTDVLQAGLLLLGAVLCVIFAIGGVEGGLGQAIALAEADDKLRMVNPDNGFMVSALWVILLGSVFSRFSNISADQSVIQRYLTTTDEKQAGRALWGDVAVSIPWAIIVFGMGTAIFVFYQANPDALAPGLRADAVVPFFISQQLPAGLSGLIIAGIFAAAMSSLDSAIHSVSTVLTTDVYRRFRGGGTDQSRLLIARGLTLLLGAFGTGIALLMTTAEILSIWDLFIEVVGLFVGMLAGLFVLGMFTTRTNSTGALLGALLGAASLYLVKQHTSMHFYLFPVVGIVVCVATGYGLSLLFPGRQRTDRLTIHTMTAVSPLTPRGQ